MSGNLSGSTSGGSPEIEEVTTAELRRWLAEGRDVQIVDVREPAEYEVTHLPGSVLIPLGQVVARRAEIDPARVVVMQCRSGIRSAKAIEQLRAVGHPGRLLNLAGGILAW